MFVTSELTIKGVNCRFHPSQGAVYLVEEKWTQTGLTIQTALKNVAIYMDETHCIA